MRAAPDRDGRTDSTVGPTAVVRAVPVRVDTNDPAGGPNAEWRPPITLERIERCCESAHRWARLLPWYANRMQRRADMWATAAGLIAAITGIAAWPATSSSAGAWETALVSGGALAAAVCALPPRIKNHGEWASRARMLAAQYGAFCGELSDLQAAYAADPASVDDDGARRTIEAFQRLKAAKDQLRGLPTHDHEPRPLRLWRI